MVRIMDIFCVMLGATKKDGERPISSVSRASYLDSKQRAFEIYSEWVEELNAYQKDGWTTGIVKVFEPAVSPNGHILAYPKDETIVEKRFGFQEESKKIVGKQKIIF